MEENETIISEKNTLTSLNIIAIILSVYVLLIFIIQTIFTLPAEVIKVLDFIDNIICVFFLVDFFNRFYKAENKLQFLKWGWIDLISSIPTFDALRFGRLLRLIRLIRILRAFRSTKHIINHIYKKKSNGAFTTVAVIAILTLIFSSISILQFEDAPDSNIKTAEDAIWWACSTISTVGYGDKFPVTTEGRIVGVILMIVGGGLFATMSGFFASWFVDDQNRKSDDKL
jgi:voltage-gated potassium channel